MDPDVGADISSTGATRIITKPPVLYDVSTEARMVSFGVNFTATESLTNSKGYVVGALV